MSYRVRLTQRARRDLDRLLRACADHSPALADRLSDHFERAISRLETFPLSCGLAYENPCYPEELRHLLFWVDSRRKYCALFVIHKDEAVVLAIRAPGERDVTPQDLSE